MNKFTCFTNKELDTMEYAFNIALDNTGLDTPQQILKKLIHEIRAERGLREKAEVDWHEKIIRRLAMNSNYGTATKSCDDDEKPVVLCMINKTLKDMYETLEGIQETLARVDDKI